jgi:type VI secretion system protein ImpE
VQAQQLFKDGKLQEAIESLGSTLRDNPADTKSRTFLFELLCFSGDYERAEKHLDLLHQASGEAMMGALVYQGALTAERTRQDMFEKKTFPRPLPEASSNGKLEGTLNGKFFSSLQDSDPRIGARLEIFAAGDYIWIPWQDVALIQMEPPKRLRDLLWTPIRLRTGPNFRDKDLGQVMLPVIAPLSWQHPDSAVILGRVTEWCADESGEEAPFGQKTLLVDGEEFPFLEIRRLEILAPKSAD